MADENPILNNPYEEPAQHYATNLEGELDYSRPVKGRRVFTPEIQIIPIRQGSQGELMDSNQVATAEHGNHIANPAPAGDDAVGPREDEFDRWICGKLSDAHD